MTEMTRDEYFDNIYELGVGKGERNIISRMMDFVVVSDFSIETKDRLLIELFAYIDEQ